MAAKRRNRVSSVKSINAANTEEWDDTGGHWSQETKAWMEAQTLKSLFFTEDWVFIVVDLIAREISNLPRKVYRKTIVDGKDNLEPAPNHPLQPLFNNPNPQQDMVAFRYLETVEHTLMGNDICWFARAKNEMYLLATELVQIDFDKQGYFYVYRPQGMYEEALTASQIKLSPTDVLHARRPNPASYIWGLSPFVPARKSVLFNRYSTDYLNAFYLKGATPQLALTMDKDASQDSVTRMLRSFEMAHTGRRNMRRTMLLPKGVDLKTIGLSVADQQLIDVIRLNRETILQTLHVPKHAVGLQESGSLGSEEHRQALKYFWQSTILPIDSAINGSYNSFFKYALGNEFVIQSDVTDVAILQEDEKIKAEQGKSLLATHTINEVRAQIYNLPPIADGNVILELAKLANKPAPITAPAPTIPATIEQSMPVVEAKATTENAPDKYSNIDFTPPKSVAAYAKRGLEWRKEYNHGGTEIGVARAIQLSNREVISPETAARGYKFFLRHERNMHNTLDNGDPANAKIASYLWGHTVGKAWFSKLWEQMKTADGADKSIDVADEDDGDLSGGTNHIEDFIKSLVDKYKAQEPYVRLANVEEKTEPEIYKQSIDFFEKMFKLALPIVVEQLTPKKEFDVPGDVPDDEVDEDVKMRKLEKLLSDAFKTLSSDWRKRYTEQLLAVLDEGYNSQLSLAFLEPARNELIALRARDDKKRRAILTARGLDSFAEISSTTTDKIMKVVADGVQNNKSVMEIARNIADKFKAISPARAETIARTETLTASSLGQAAAMNNAAEVIKGVKKIWINAGDELVRGNPNGKYKNAQFDHWDVQNDGPIDWDKPFSNGLQFPREPGGKAGNVINCRCTMMTIAAADLSTIRVPKR